MAQPDERGASLGKEWRFAAGRPAHIGVVTNDIEEAIAGLSTMFDLTWETPRLRQLDLVTPAGSVDWWFKVAHSSGPIGIELLQGPAGSIWETDGTARLHHYAYWSDDFPAQIALLESDGWTMEITMRGSDGTAPAVFAYFSKPGEPRIELIARQRTVAS